MLCNLDSYKGRLKPPRTAGRTKVCLKISVLKDPFRASSVEICQANAEAGNIYTVIQFCII